MVMERLKGHELFGMLSPKEVERLSEASGVLRLKEGERVYSEGMPASHIFVLLKGRVELRRPAKGTAGFLVDDLTEGSLLGVSSLTGLERYLLNAECMEDSELVKIEARVLRRILDENPVVGYATQRRVSEIYFRRHVAAMENLHTLTQATLAGTVR
jgi:CRP-like cAMP-binding protein